MDTPTKPVKDIIDTAISKGLQTAINAEGERVPEGTIPHFHGVSSLITLVQLSKQLLTITEPGTGLGESAAGRPQREVQRSRPRRAHRLRDPHVTEQPFLNRGCLQRRAGPYCPRDHHRPSGSRLRQANSWCQQWRHGYNRYGIRDEGHG
jgi:hypothetical protein